jgi:hypothetical protein
MSISDKLSTGAKPITASAENSIPDSASLKAADGGTGRGALSATDDGTTTQGDAATEVSTTPLDGQSVGQLENKLINRK